MRNLETLNDTLTLSTFTKRKPDYSLLNNFSIIENLNVSKGTHFRNEHQAECMSIFIVTKGHGRIMLKEGEIDIRENSLINLVSNRIDTTQGQPFYISGVCFTRDFIEETGILNELMPNIFNLFLTNPFLVWELEPRDALVIKHQISLLGDRLRRFATHPFGKEILIHGFYIFLFEIGAIQQKHQNLDYLAFSRQEIHVYKFKRLVQQQFRENRTIKEYATQLSVSAKYLTEIVKQLTGKNPSEIITEQVIREAKLLLQNPQLSIGEIAYKLHFSDQAFFGKYFKRYTGISPKTYRGSEFENKRNKRLQMHYS